MWQALRDQALVLAGGVALNCVANGRLFREGEFEDLWIQPAAGDAGGSLGAALSSGINSWRSPVSPTVLILSKEVSLALLHNRPDRRTR